MQEAGDVFEDKRFYRMAEQLTETGDRWREFACLAARNCKKRATQEESYNKLGEILSDCADREESLFTELKHLVKSITV